MAEILDDRECRLLADLLAVFANPTRLTMFCALQSGPKTVSELAEHAQVSLQNASQHLRLMRDKGTVTTQKQGQQVLYTTVDARFLEGAHMMKDALIDALHRKIDFTREAD